GFDHPHPDGVVLAQPRVGVRRLAEDDAVAAVFLALLPGLCNRDDEFFEARIDTADRADADCAGQAHAAVRYLEFAIAMLVAQLLRPRLRVASAAEFQAGHQYRPFEGTSDVAQRQTLAYFRGQLGN